MREPSCAQHGRLPRRLGWGHVSAERRHWRPGPRNPVLQAGAVHVWWAQLDDVGRSATDVLSPSEWARAERILAPSRRLRWAASRTLLRLLLGRYLGVEPGRVELETGPHGKPCLALDAGLEPGRPRAAGPLAPDFGFSLSHCRGTALLAVASERRVGVDLELPRALPRVSALARRAFGAERARELEDLPRPLREAAFLRLWTRLEAELKCAGTGLPAAGNPGRALWTLELPTGEEEAATLALDAAPAGVRLWSWCPEPAEPGSEDADGDRLREGRAFVDRRQDYGHAVMLA